MKPLLQLGYISRAHGIRGEIAVKPFDPGSESLLEVERLVLQPRGSSETREYKVESVRPTPKEFLLLLEGVLGRSAAEACVGSTVFVHREDLEPPAEGEFFQGDLIGLAAFDEQGVRLGTVEELWETGPVPNLVIRGENVVGEELVVPFVDEFVPTVSLAEGRLVVRPPVYED